MTESESRPLLNGPLTLAAIGLDIVPCDKKVNLSRAAASIKDLAGHADVAILPEMFSTGYILDGEKARALAEPSDGPTIEWATATASACNMAVAGSFIALDHDGRLFNRAFFTEPSGETTYYDKRHLFAPGGENNVYTPGNAPIPLVRFRGWNIAIAVCYDLRFPVWLRNIRGAYDLLIVVADWPDSRAYAWKQLLIARAIENQAYVAGCNRCGEDSFGTYAGTSAIIDPKGNVIGTEAHTPDGTQCVVSRISRSALYDFREKFPAFLHGDTFTID